MKDIYTMSDIITVNNVKKNMKRFNFVTINNILQKYIIFRDLTIYYVYTLQFQYQNIVTWISAMHCPTSYRR
jgi:hypothetical protein